MERTANNGTWHWGELAYPARLVIYGGITVAAFLLLHAGLQHSGPQSLAAENGPIELTQVVLAISGALALFYAAWRCPVGRFGLTASASFLAYAAARESDALLESLLFDDAYKFVFGLPLMALIALTLWRAPRGLIAESLWLMRQPQATLFVMAGIFLVSYCQMLDRPGTWESLSRPAEAGVIGVLVEESSELFAYLLLMFSAIEGALMARRLAHAVGNNRRIAAGTPATEEAVPAPSRRAA